jgi:NAD(P)-dependent dehydrogenase (short-subunit alcohol dehydrogenase family)
MKMNIAKKLAGMLATLTGGSLGFGVVVAKRLVRDGADVASVFVTNGGYNGVQQVLRLSRPLRQSRARSNCDQRPNQNGKRQ